MAWQMQLRRRDRRSARIKAWEARASSGDIAAWLRGAKDGVASVLAMLPFGGRSSSAASVASSAGMIAVASTASRAVSSASTIIAAQPPVLPSSGPEWSLLGVPMLAGYCATLHRRAARRKRA
jgi:hypothetical protein